MSARRARDRERRVIVIARTQISLTSACSKVSAEQRDGGDCGLRKQISLMKAPPPL